jgi:hypothetical protein
VGEFPKYFLKELQMLKNMVEIASIISFDFSSDSMKCSMPAIELIAGITKVSISLSISNSFVIFMRIPRISL